MSQQEPAAAEQAAPSSGRAGGPPEPAPLPRDLVSPQFTLRAVLTGMFLAGLLSMCNVYTGLKIGWSLNMSITAALVSYGFWMGLRGLSARRVRYWGILENNINQTACSAGASVSSAGLVAPIPALAMLTGQTLSWHYLALWVFSVCLVGITIAVALRRQMLLVDRLPFPVGIASAETLREMYARGREALARVAHLATGAVVAATLTLVTEIRGISRWAPAVALRGFPVNRLSFSLEPTLLFYGIGGLIGFRACVSLLLGAVFAWAVLAPPLIRRGDIRLTVAEPLARLPGGAAKLRGPSARASYDAARRLLRWSGVMSAAERAELLALSDDPLYRQAVRKLYLRSQLPLAVPLAELPARVNLSRVAAVGYDRARGLLYAAGGLDRALYESLREQSLDPAYRRALRKLYGYFDYTTTRVLRISEPLRALPRRFGFLPRHYPIPPRRAGEIGYDRQRQALVAFGPLSADCRRELLEAAERARQRWRDPGAQLALEAFRHAVERLYARSAESFLPAGVRIPAELADVVAYDPRRQTLSARGVVTEEQGRQLRSLSADPEYRATVAALLAGSRFRPAIRNAPGWYYRDLLKWLLWPGVTLMVVSSLSAFACSWRAILAALPGRRRAAAGATAAAPATGEVARRWFVGGLIVALLLSVALQISFFEIVWWAAVVGVLLSFALALVAARVSGETSITPVGAMGKVTQLVFGVLVPRNPVPNLMAANVTGGAASQCADLLHDLKCGHLLGAAPRLQALAQLCGALAGALVGSGVYLFLFPNPGAQLMTAEFPAPAVAAWKAVAELFMVGLAAIPAGAPRAMLLAALAGAALPVIDRLLPPAGRRYMLSPASFGLAMIIPAYNSLALFVGGLATLALGRWCPGWRRRFLVAVCAGIIAGESLTGVGIAFRHILAS